MKRLVINSFHFSPSRVTYSRSCPLQHDNIILPIQTTLPDANLSEYLSILRCVLLLIPSGSNSGKQTSLLETFTGKPHGQVFRRKMKLCYPYYSKGEQNITEIYGSYSVIKVQHGALFTVFHASILLSTSPIF